MLWRYLLVAFTSMYLKVCGGFNRKALTLRSEMKLSMHQNDNSGELIQEIILYNPECTLPINAFSDHRPQLSCIPSVDHPNSYVTWFRHNGDLQLDSTKLEDYWLGTKHAQDSEIVQKWITILDERNLFMDPQGPSNSLQTLPEDACDIQIVRHFDLSSGKSLGLELEVAIAAVQRASFMSRSLQSSLSKTTETASKSDYSPVTIADFAVQALVIDALSTCFPGDNFVAEEDSSILREDADIRSSVLNVLRVACDDTIHSDPSSLYWTEQRLFKMIDRGQYLVGQESSGSDNALGRVWVLDPIDGTKGFIRGQHYCIALGLLIDGLPELSVLGCPNQNLMNAFDAVGSDAKARACQVEAMGAITHLSEYQIPEIGSSSATRSIYVPPLDSGSIFYATSGAGAFARSLSMPLGAAFEVNTSLKSKTEKALMSEAAESSHGDRSRTVQVRKSLNIDPLIRPIHIDGQCKSALVGCGAVDFNLRLPPHGYREKIWDHVPGTHFITEAGGRVTDLQGNLLDFRGSRFLPDSVTGVVSSNGIIHQKILDALLDSKPSDLRDSVQTVMNEELVEEGNARNEASSGGTVTSSSIAEILAEQGVTMDELIAGRDDAVAEYSYQIQARADEDALVEGKVRDLVASLGGKCGLAKKVNHRVHLISRNGKKRLWIRGGMA
jgi:3'(2'), 5'-bisphosphate nucleotidase